MCAAPVASPATSRTSVLLFSRLSNLCQTLERVSGPQAPSPDKVRELLNDPVVFQCLSRVLDAFPGASAKSREAVQKDHVTLSVGPVKISGTNERNAVLKLSTLLNLDEQMTVELLHNFLGSKIFLRHMSVKAADSKYRFSPEDIQNVVEFYYDHRLLVIRSLCQLVRITFVDSDECQEVCSEFFTKLTQSRPDFLLNVVAMYISKADENMPNEMADTRTLWTAWIRQNLQEQVNLLELLFLLFYDRFSATWTLVGRLLETFVSHGFGQRTPAAVLAVDRETQELVQVNLGLCILVILNAMCFESFLDSSPSNPTPPLDTILPDEELSAFIQVDKLVANLSRSESKIILAAPAAPIQLAWSCVLGRLSVAVETQQRKTLIETQKRCSNFQDLAVTAFISGAFNILTSLFRVPFFQHENAIGYKSVLKGLLMLFATTFPIENLPSYEGLLNFTVSIFRGEESLCFQFWQQDYLYPARRTLLNLCQAEFPLNPGLLTLLLALAGEPGGESANFTLQYMQRFDSFTEAISASTLQAATNWSPLASTDQIEVTHESGLCFVPSATPNMPVIIPQNVKGIVRGVRQEGTVVIVQWLWSSSGTSFLLHVLNAHINSRVLNTQWLTSILQLLQTILSPDDMTVLRLLSPVERVSEHDIAYALLSAILQLVTISAAQFVVAPSLPLQSLLLAAVRCVVSLIPMIDHGAVAELCLQAQLFPIVHEFSSMESSSGIERGWLARILEQVEGPSGTYSVTLGTLDLLNALLPDKIIVTTNDTVCQLARAAISFLVDHVLLGYENWRYEFVIERFQLAGRAFGIINRLFALIPYQSHGHSLQKYLVELTSSTALLNATLSVVGLGPDVLVSVFRKLTQAVAQEAETLIIAAFQVLHKLLLVKTEPERLLHFVLERTIGSPPVDLLFIIASYHRYLYNPRLLLLALQTLTLLCRLAGQLAVEQRPPSLIGYLAQQTDSLCHTLVHILQDGEEDLLLKLGVLNFLAASLDTQPGLAAHLMQPPREVSSKRATAKPTSTKTFQASDSGFLGALIDILTEPSDSALVEASVRVIEVLWSSADDYPVVLKALRTHASFWDALVSALLIKPSDPTAPTELIDVAKHLMHCARILRMIAVEVAVVDKSEAHIQNIIKQIQDKRVLEWFGQWLAISADLKNTDLHKLKEAVQALVPLNSLKPLFSQAMLTSTSSIPGPAYQWSLDLVLGRVSNKIEGDLNNLNATLSLLDSSTAYLHGWRKMLDASTRSFEKLWWLSPPNGSSDLPPIYNTIIQILQAHHVFEVREPSDNPNVLHAAAIILLNLIELHKDKVKDVAKPLASAIVDWLASEGDIIPWVGIAANHPICDPTVASMYESLLLVVRHTSAKSAALLSRILLPATNLLSCLLRLAITSPLGKSVQPQMNSKRERSPSKQLFPPSPRPPQSPAFVLIGLLTEFTQCSWISSSDWLGLLVGSRNAFLPDVLAVLRRSLTLSLYDYGCDSALHYAQACLSLLSAFTTDHLVVAQKLASLEVGTLFCFNDVMNLLRQTDFSDVNLVCLGVELVRFTTNLLISLRPSPPQGFMAEIVSFTSMLDSDAGSTGLLAWALRPLEPPIAGQLAPSNLMALNASAVFYYELSVYWVNVGQKNGIITSGSIERTTAILLSQHTARLPALIHRLVHLLKRPDLLETATTGTKPAPTSQLQQIVVTLICTARLLSPSVLDAQQPLSQRTQSVVPPFFGPSLRSTSLVDDGSIGTFVDAHAYFASRPTTKDTVLALESIIVLWVTQMHMNLHATSSRGDATSTLDKSSGKQKDAALQELMRGCLTDLSDALRRLRENKTRAANDRDVAMEQRLSSCISLHEVLIATLRPTEMDQQQQQPTPQPSTPQLGPTTPAVRLRFAL